MEDYLEDLPLLALEVFFLKFSLILFIYFIFHLDTGTN